MQLEEIELLCAARCVIGEKQRLMQTSELDIDHENLMCELRSECAGNMSVYACALGRTGDRGFPREGECGQET